MADMAFAFGIVIRQDGSRFLHSLGEPEGEGHL